MFDPNCGVYVITCPSGKRYVGQSVNIKRRWARHRVDLRSGKHVNRKLLNTANKYGVESLTFAIWRNCSPTNLGTMEILAHSEILPELNLGACGDAPGLGRKKSDEERKKISERTRGRKLSPQSIERLREARKNQVTSEETRQKMRLAMTGRRFAPETIEKMTQSARLRSSNPDIVAKLSDAQRKYWARVDEETINARMAAVRAGQNPPPKIPVRCVDTGQEFSSLDDVKSALGYDPFSIKRACRGVRKTAYGMKWEFI